MKFNFSALLTNGMKFLNIANKAIPVIKELNPTYNKIKNRFSSNNINTITYTNKIHKNNNLTFFK